MYNFLLKRGQTVAFLLGLLIAVGFLVSVFGGLETFESLGKEEKGTTGIFNFGLYSAIGLAMLAALAAIVAGLIHLVLDFRSSIKFLIGLAVVFVVFFIMYAISTGGPTPGMEDLFIEKGISDSLSRWISAGLRTVVTLSGLCVLAIVASEIWNIFK